MSEQYGAWLIPFDPNPFIIYKFFNWKCFPTIGLLSLLEDLIPKNDFLKISFFLIIFLASSKILECPMLSDPLLYDEPM